jgi:hypothetical protein
MKEISLSPGHVAIVDDIDFDRCAKIPWRLHRTNSGTYARCFSLPHRGLYLHHFICPPGNGQEVDHRDRDGLNNRRDNLRVCDSSKNKMNCGKKSGCTSPYKGVYWDKARNKWSARAGTRKNLRVLGRFDSPLRAALAYDGAAREMFGEFAKLNFPRSLGEGQRTFCFVGFGRSGKDEAGAFLHTLGIRYGGSTSWQALPFMSEKLGLHPLRAWETRHQHRQVWKDYLDELRRGDETLFMEMALATGDIITGIRDRAEIEAAKQKNLFDRIVWVHRPNTPPDPTVTFGPADCDEEIYNAGTLEQYHDGLRLWALQNGILRPVAPAPTTDLIRE